MKKLMIFLALLIAGTAFAAKMSEYDEDSSPTNDDIIMTVDTTSGLNKKVQLGNLPNSAAGGFTDGGANITLTTSTDNVGIGSATPGERLDVTGTVRATSFSGDGSALTGISGASGGWTESGTVISPTDLADNVGIGTSTASSPLKVIRNSNGFVVSVEQNDANTSSAQQVFEIRRMTTGTAANGLGAMLDFTLEDDAGNADTAVRIAPQWEDVTSGSEDSSLREQVKTAGSFATKYVRQAGKMTMNASHLPTAMLDIYSDGSSPTLRARNSGGTALTVITHDGNLGIGSTNPNHQIDVVGTIRATSYQGDGSALTGVGGGGWTENGSSIYQTDFADNVGIGTHATTIPLTVKTTVDNAFAGRVISEGTPTNNAAQVFDFQRRTTGTAAAGFGAMVDWTLEDDAGNAQAAYRITPTWVDPTNTAEDSKTLLQISDAGTMRTSWVQYHNGFMKFNITTDTIPTAPIDVNGEGSSTGPTQYWKTSGNVINNAFLDNGNVGIGSAFPHTKMVVVGGVIQVPKHTTDPCSAGVEGGVFYNDTGNYMCYCNGTDDVKTDDSTTACF